MTPNNSDSMSPPPAKRRVTRSATFKLGLAEFSSIGFFSSHGTTCDPSQRAEVSEELYRDAYDDVERAVREYKARMGAIAQETLHPEQVSSPAKPAENPFRVSQAAPTGLAPAEAATAPFSPSNEEAKGAVGPVPTEKSNLDTVKTQEVKPEAETKRGRGRPPKSAAPINEPAKSQPVEESPQNIGKESFKASDDDLPKELGGTSEVPPGPDLKAKHEEIRAAEAAKAAIPAKPNGPQLVPPSKPALGQWERIQAVMDTLASQGKRTKENVEAGVKTFCKSFLNRDKLPKPPDDLYGPIVPILERIAQINPGVLLADPGKAGLEAGVGWNKFARHTEKWRDELKSAATAVVLIKYPDNAMDLLDFLHGVAKLDNLDKNLYVFLRTMAVSNAAIAMTLRSTSEEKGTPMADMMEGLDWTNCTEGDILARISGVEKPVQSGQPAQTESLWPE